MDEARAWDCYRDLESEANKAKDSYARRRKAILRKLLQLRTEIDFLRAPITVGPTLDEISTALDSLEEKAVLQARVTGLEACLRTLLHCSMSREERRRIITRALGPEPVDPTTLPQY